MGIDNNRPRKGPQEDSMEYITLHWTEVWAVLALFGIQTTALVMTWRDREMWRAGR